MQRAGYKGTAVNSPDSDPSKRPLLPSNLLTLTLGKELGQESGQEWCCSSLKRQVLTTDALPTRQHHPFAHSNAVQKVHACARDIGVAGLAQTGSQDLRGASSLHRSARRECINVNVYWFLPDLPGPHIRRLWGLCQSFLLPELARS